MKQDFNLSVDGFPLRGKARVQAKLQPEVQRVIKHNLILACRIQCGHALIYKTCLRTEARGVALIERLSTHL